VKLYVKWNKLYIVFIIWRKGPSKNRQEGEDGEICIFVYIYTIGGRGRARTGRRGKTVITLFLVFMYVYMLLGGRGRARTGRRGKTVKIILCVCI